MTIYKGNNFRTLNTLDTKVHFKPTDTHELLHKKSFHPPHTFKGIIKSQIIRFDRICNNTEDFNTAINTVFTVLHKRGYKRTFTTNVYTETTEKIKNNKDLTPLIRNCNVPQCKLHPYLEATNTIEYNEKQHIITENMSCDTTNIIYSIRCTLCNQRYIGHTKNTLRERFYAHKSTVIHNKNKVLAKHINSCIRTYKYSNKDILPMKITPLAQVPTQEDKEINTISLVNKETELITKLKTTAPDGINAPKDAQQAIPIPLKYSDNTTEVTSIFNNCHLKLQKKFPKIYRRKPIIAHMKNQNIKDYIVRTKLN